MIAYLNNDSTDHTVTFATGGKRYEYWLTAQQCTTVDWLAHKVSTGKAFAFAKSHALRTEQVPS